MSTFKSLNPTNLSDVVVETKLATPDEIADAARRAKAAQKAWAKMPAPARGRVIANAGRLFENNKEALSKLVTREMGKVYREALGDVQEVIDTCDFFLGEGRRLYGQTVPSEMPNKNLFTFRMPVGTALIITAGNFPAAVPSWYIIPALLTGNSVVWKPSEFTPAVAEAMTAIFHAAGVPKDVLITVVAEGKETFEGMVKGLDEGTINKVGFTGSTEVGRLIGAKVGEYIQSACLELGGKNPMIVCADANLETFLEVAVRGCFTSAGQLCVSIERMYIHESIYEKFLSALVEKVKELKLGAQLGWGYDVGSLVTDALVNRVSDAVSTAVSQGAKIETGGKLRTDIGPNVYEPTVLTGVTKDMKISTEEVFGPCVYVQPFSSNEEAIALANDSIYGLSASVITSNARNGRRIAEQIRSGSVNINEGFAAAYGSVAAPMGGMGQSGLGRRHGIEGLLRFTQPQTIARQRWISIGPKFGFNEESWTKLLSNSLLILKRLRIR